MAVRLGFVAGSGSARRGWVGGRRHQAVFCARAIPEEVKVSEYLKLMSNADLTPDVRRAKLRELSRSIPLVRDRPPDSPELQVVYEDELFLVVAKPAGIRTHPVHRFEGGSLLNRALGYLDVAKLHTVHRLDQPTSGLVLFMKNPVAAEAVNVQFRERTVKKQYLAIVDLVNGIPLNLLENDVVPIDHSIARHPTHKRRRCIDEFGADAKPGRTLVRLLGHHSTHALVAARPLSGRTHQIRLHVAEESMPIVGDDMYGIEATNFTADEDGAKKTRAILDAPGYEARSKLMLHAHKLQLVHPQDSRQIEFTAPPPEHFVQTADKYSLGHSLNSSGCWVDLQ